MSKFYFQVILDDEKEIDKIYIDFINSLLLKGLKKKEILKNLIDNFESDNKIHTSISKPPVSDKVGFSNDPIDKKELEGLV